jgi:hypothetical protein
MLDRKPPLVSPDPGIRPTEPNPAPETQEFDPPTSAGSLRFALLWFGIPVLLLVALILLRRPG